MAKLRLKIEGALGTISLTIFCKTVAKMAALLSELEATIRRDTSVEVEWVVTDLAVGSLVVEIQSHAPPTDSDMGPRVAQAFVSGLEIIEQQGATPPHYTQRALRQAQDLVKVIGRNGAKGLIVETEGKSVEITRAAGPQLRALLTVTRPAIGSVEGRLETISVHRTDHFIVYHTRTGKAVECMIRSDDQLARAKEALGHRVNVAGLVYSNVRGEPVRVRVEGIRIFPSASDLPSIQELAGSDSEFTGGLSTDEFIRYARGE